MTRKHVRLRCAMMAKEIEFEINKDSYGRRSQVEFGLNGPNEEWTSTGRGSIGESNELMGRLGKMGLTRTTFVDCWRVTKMYSPTSCSKNCRQRVENNFVQQSIEFLNYVVTNEVCEWVWRWPRQSKSASRPWPKKKLRSLLGLAKYYCRFNQDFSKVARTLSNLVKKQLSQGSNEPYHEAFEELKSRFSLPYVLKYSNFYKYFDVYTEARDFVDARCMAIVYESIKLDGCPTISDLLKKWLSQGWNEPCYQAFGELKSKLSSPLMLKFVEFYKPFAVHAGASDFAIGGLMMQNGWPLHTRAWSLMVVKGND